MPQDSLLKYQGAAQTRNARGGRRSGSPSRVTLILLLYVELYIATGRTIRRWLARLLFDFGRKGIEPYRYFMRPQLYCLHKEYHASKERPHAVPASSVGRTCTRTLTVCLSGQHRRVVPASCSAVNSPIAYIPPGYGAESIITMISTCILYTVHCAPACSSYPADHQPQLHTPKATGRTDAFVGSRRRWMG